MKTRNRITKLIALTITAAALVIANLLCGDGWLQDVKAQTGDGSVRFVSYSSIGIVPGQRIRLNVANTGASGGSLSLSFQFYLAHGTNASTSVPVYESEWIKVPAREFRFSDVSRRDLNVEGDPETRRVQLIVKVTLMAPAGSTADDFPSSLQIEEEVQRGTIWTYKNGSEFGTKVIYQPATDSSWMPSELKTPIGVMPGNKLRYSFFYPTEAGSQPVRVTSYTYDSYGNLLKQTDPVILRPGDFQTVDINRDDLPLAGEEETGRLQIRPSIQVVLMDGSVRPIKLSVSRETVNNRTGKTSGGNYYCGSVTVADEG